MHAHRGGLRVLDPRKLDRPRPRPGGDRRGAEAGQTKFTQIQKLATRILDLQYIGILVELWKIGRKLMRGMINEGIYETLEYESTLEIQNRKGTKATFNKRKKIRYLQNNIIAYQDYGWGDGEILLNYRTSSATF